MSANLQNIIKLIIGAIGFLCLLIFTQSILAARNHRIDLTPQKKFTFSLRAAQVVSNLKQDVQAFAFVNSDRPENFFVDDMLARMAQLSRHFSYRLVEMNRNPALAREYSANQYGTLVFESRGHRKSALLNTGENGVIATLLQVTRNSEKGIYFLTGHDEGDLSDSNPQRGYTKLRGAMADEFYFAKPFTLSTTGAVPDDAAVVVLLNPRAPLLEFELAALDAYIQRGGALLTLLDTTATPSLIPFLEKYNVRLPPLVAVDPSKRLYAGEVVTFRTSPTSHMHQMISSVNAPPIFSLARVVEVRQEPNKNITPRPILATSGNGFATAEQNIGNDGLATFVEDRDIHGPIPVAGEVDLKVGDKLGRIVVFGDVDFSNNALLEQGGNKDLLVNAINWLAEDIAQMAARPESQRAGVNQLFLSAEQGNWVFWVSTVALPSSFLVMGIGIFLWRRQRG
ncbi:MAG: Gldg family protein [Deltaproteobacteria bacterium]|nr:Gldg family protein [Deltaproteobacteria bacterium]